MFSIASSNLCQDNIVAFVVGLDDDGCVIRFVRGIGLGRELEDIDFGVCALGPEVVSYDQVMIAAAAHLRQRLGSVLAAEPWASLLERCMADEPERHGALGIYLVGDDDEETLGRLSDFALANLAAVALKDLDTMAVSRSHAEVASMEICTGAPALPPGICRAKQPRSDRSHLRASEIPGKPGLWGGRDQGVAGARCAGPAPACRRFRGIAPGVDGACEVAFWL